MLQKLINQLMIASIDAKLTKIDINHSQSTLTANQGMHPARLLLGSIFLIPGFYGLYYGTTSCIGSINVSCFFLFLASLAPITFGAFLAFTFLHVDFHVSSGVLKRSLSFLSWSAQRQEIITGIRYVIQVRSNVTGGGQSTPGSNVRFTITILCDDLVILKFTIFNHYLEALKLAKDLSQLCKDCPIMDTVSDVHKLKA